MSGVRGRLTSEMWPSGFFSATVSFTLWRTLMLCLVKSCTHWRSFLGRSSFFSMIQPSCPVSSMVSCQWCVAAPNFHLPTSLSNLHSLFLDELLVATQSLISIRRA